MYILVSFYSGSNLIITSMFSTQGTQLILILKNTHDKGLNALFGPVKSLIPIICRDKMGW